jgi:predicted ATP-grasp superfamily ATP-dependent carboligase
MKRIFVLEYLSGGGLDGPGPADADRELLAAGIAMRDAIVADLLALDGVQVSVAAAPGAHPASAAAMGASVPGRPLPPAGAPLPPGTHPAPPGAHGAGATGQPPAPAAAHVAPAPGEAVEDFVRRVAPAHDASWIVAPETGGVLARLRAAVGAAGWLGCAQEAIACAASKSATLARLSARGVPTPLDLADGHRGRWIVKPDDGAGTLATRVHPDRACAEADLAARRAAGAEATLEPFVEGEALSISMIVGANLAGFTRIVAFNRQRIVADADGWLRDEGVQSAAIDPQADPRAQALRGLAWEVADALPGLRGFVGIDLIWNEERGPVLIEVNPRATTAYVGLSRRLGRNLAADVLRCAGGAEANHALAR